MAPGSLRRRSSIGDSPDLHVALRTHFGFDGFREGQEALIRAAVRGRDALGIMPTGGGKTLCFQLPALLLPGLVVVVSPLISLMDDQVGRARTVGLRCALLNSTQAPSESDSARRKAVAGDLDLLFLAPERFHVPRFRELLHRIDVSLLAVDEAHCISEWGHDFRPEYATLGRIRRLLGAPVLALTATATPRVAREIVESLGLANPERVVLDFDRPNLGWEVRRAGGHGERIRALRHLMGQTVGDEESGSTVIYAQTRRSVEAVRRDLSRFGHPVRAYHAGLPDGVRKAAQEWFLEEEGAVIVATNAFGMGVDKPDVRRVLHYQLSGSLEAHYQEGGRGGRDGRPARCTALYHPRDFDLHRRFLLSTHPPEREARRMLRRLRRLVGPGRRDVVGMDALVAAGGRDADESSTVAMLRSLERAGAIRLYRCPEVGAADWSHRDSVEVGVHSRRFDPAPGNRLRRLGMERIGVMEEFATARGCRRRLLLHYFGEDPPDRCRFCDRCTPHLFSPSALG